MYLSIIVYAGSGVAFTEWDFRRESCDTFSMNSLRFCDIIFWKGLFMMSKKSDYAGGRSIRRPQMPAEHIFRAAARTAPTYIQNRTMITTTEFNYLNDRVQ